MMTSFSEKSNSDLARNLRSVPLEQEQLVTFCQQHPIRKLTFFSSILRADFTDNSDIDLLVEFLPNAKLCYSELVRIENELTELLGRKADSRTPRELSQHFRQEVIDEAVMQYVKD
jgi:predicted nucleotidyltransferase